MWLLSIVIFGLSALIGAGWLLWRELDQHCAQFRRMQIQYVPPLATLCNTAQMFCSRQSAVASIAKFYKRFAHTSVYGYCNGSTPLLVVRDPDIIKAITVKDFDHFVDHHPMYPNYRDEPMLAQSLFMLRGEKWRDMRTTLSPAFTGRKVRYMFHLVVECAQQMAQVLRTDAAQMAEREESAAAVGYSREMVDLSTRFATDVIASAAFGMRVDSLRNPTNTFYTVGRSAALFDSWWFQQKLLLMNYFPRVTRLLGFCLFSQTQRDFYHNLVHGEIRHRAVNGIVRPDMVHLLMEARRGYLRYEAEMVDVSQQFANSQPDAGATGEIGGEDMHQGFRKRFWDDTEVTAQCFLFFLAGYETISTLLSFAVQELALNQSVQDRLLAELDEVNSQLGGEPLTYELLHGMKYLDMVVTETLRKWPPAITIDRVCTRDYEMHLPEGRSIQVAQGTCIWMPVYSMHRDAEFFPDPELFDPERFGEERRHEIKPFTFLGLGAGPRNCIGSRFALMEVKAFLYFLLSTFRLKPGADMQPTTLDCTIGSCLRPSSVNLRLQLREEVTGNC